MSNPQQSRRSSPQRATHTRELTKRLRRVQAQLQKLVHSPEGISPTTAQDLSQELDTVATALQRGGMIPPASKNQDTSSFGAVGGSKGLVRPHMPDPFLQIDSHFVTDASGIIQLADHSATLLLALPSNKLTGQNLLDLLAPNDRFVLLQHLRKLEDGEPGLEWEMTLAPAGGHPFDAFLTISALRNPDGVLSSVHWLIRNISAQKRMMGSDELTQALGEHVLEGVTLPEILSHLCQHFVQVFAYPLVWVALKELDGEVTLAAQAGSHSSVIGNVDFELSAADVTCVKAVMASQVSHGFQVSDSEWPHKGFGQRYGLKASLFVPLCARGQVLGVLAVGASREDAFDVSTGQWLEKLASQVSVSLLLVKEYEHLRVRGAAIASAEHAVFITDPKGRIEWVNDAYTRLTGYGAAELIGTIPQVLKSSRLRTTMRKAHRHSTPGKLWRHELVDERKDGRSFMVELVFTPLRNDQGKITHFVAIHQDITLRKETEAKFFHLAHHDPLTDLPNRTMFFDRLKQALGQARRHDRAVGVMFLDLDRFKFVNDEFGHEMGDELLRTVAGRLTQCVRATDTVARLSGDEFTILLQDLERDQDAGHVAQKILETLAQPLEVGGQVILVHASIGIALFPFDAKDPDLLIAQADRGMYRAKEKGGHCYQFVSEELNSQAFERLMLEKSLQTAWQQEEFTLHFQPEVDVRTGNLLGMEALLRWQHPELGLVFPHQFLSLAKESSFFSSLQEWVLRKACEQNQQWKTLGLPTGPITVNLSVSQDDPDVVIETIKRALHQTGYDPKGLAIEISQTTVMGDQEGVSRLVEKAADLGIACVLDDVEDSESLSRLLKRVPFRRLKLASSLVFDLPSSSHAVDGVQQCLGVARAAHLDITAKGVESAGQVTFLREHGCHHLQGYLCSRPLPANEMTTLLRGWWASEF
ncbi:EAL domain-containing protein [Candidatus Nitronereus thalassa]|uniref:EAL domain-containing protein n=1 Tax=Candidatus Nitronereus thalassa TaxID=3020898 RepID=A0ABU3K3L6_9BACT|nr:EAL domain-containing protein [Candidatus Nitronereus thalassa]MDT7040981.1 EAL domain-containing protein [Candidatus Nitronereus thalassa]